MAILRYLQSDLIIGDPENIALEADDPGLDEARLDRALEGLILSPSGWRGIFAADGGEESPAPEINPAQMILLAAAASVFADYLKKTKGVEHPALIVGMDTRPTGPAIAGILIRAFLAEGCHPRFAFITAAPEIMAYAASFGPGDGVPPGSPASGVPGGFVFISASHNPIGHNGLKFGLTDGGVLPGPEALSLIEAFRARMAAPDRIPRGFAAVTGADIPALTRVFTEAPRIKAEARSAYLRFTRKVVSGGSGKGPADGQAGETLREAIDRGIRERPLGIAADLNGSARTLSIDGEFFGSLGLKFEVINGQPREIRHRIVPEGEALEPCRVFLETLHRRDPAFVLGYVPDCDGDRGNLVVWDEGTGSARSLEAQEVFALACLSELAHLVWTGELKYDNRGNALNKVAVVVNDPTSMRIDRIADAFDASVFRAEVGEANVVSLARKLRERGYTVRILGEGSAGGAITHPSAVRDPIDTVMALIKLLCVRSAPEKAGGRKGFFELWCDLSNQTELYRPDFSLADIIASLPAFISTGAYTPEALLQVKTGDHGLMKDRYQAVFLREWEERREALKTRYGITGWEAAAYNGIEERRGLTRFSEAGRGGLRIIFTNEKGRPVASLWMRGSGTEPVFRIMADTEGPDKRPERDLIDWQRRMVLGADATADVTADVTADTTTADISAIAGQGTAKADSPLL
ncbi:MAG: phosphatidylglycerol lysyltransferase [Spirochaetaceae bacterium]|jgi:phosphoglucomutase|nr:phosphatidylglycerol lysyltransferase [Spirochaetaceae bacterium]